MTRGRFASVAWALLVLAATSPSQASAEAVGRPFRSAAPSPETWFGRRPGADRFLASWEGLGEYFRALDAASDRVVVEELGRSTEGRPLFVVYVSSPENLARRGEIAAYNRRVARGAADEEEIRAGRFPASVLLTAGIHATEYSGTQGAPELAWLLASGGAPGAARILDQVLFALVPCFNPDGSEIVRKWYERTVDGPWEGTWPPVLYHPYAGHDNNRDAYALRLAESRLVNRLLYAELQPQLYVDQHHMGNSDARMFVGELSSPLNPALDPLTVADVELVGGFVRSAMTAEGRRGLIHRANWGGFWQGAFFTNAWAHHIPAILTETATTRLASPIFQRERDLDGSYFRGVGKDGNAKDWNHPWPWTGGWWRPRDAVEYDVSAALHALDAAATFRAKLALDRRAAALRSIADGSRAPVGWILAPTAEDPEAPRRLAELLIAGGADVERCSAAVSFGGELRPSDTLFVPAAQPFGPFVRDCLEAQTYPEPKRGPDGAPLRPFELTGWTPAFLMGVDVVPVSVWPAGAPPRKAFDAALRARGEGPASRPWNAPPGAAAKRVAVYRPWTANMDEGWTRLVLETHRIPHVSAYDADFRKGGLAGRFDVVLLTSVPAREIRDGHPPGSMPPEFCGGLGPEGAAALAAFVRAGGRLVCVDKACEFALELFGGELGIVDATATLDPAAFACPGALVGVEVSAAAEAGTAPDLVLPFLDSRAFDLAPQAESSARAKSGPTVLARYARTRLLRSGWMLGPDRIAGKVMAVRTSVGAGEVVLFGAPVAFRAQTEAAFPLLFDALLR